MPNLTVVGSVNVDLVLSAARLPLPGETLTGATFAEVGGGKGANQALAVRRLGADVRLIARVGDDARGSLALTQLRGAGVDLSAVVVDEDAPTGIAAVTVAASGENHIVVASGANAHLGAADVTASTVEGSTRVDGVLCQLEIPDEAVLAASLLDPAIFCVNAAPARSLPSQVLERADLIVVNEIERDALAGQLRSFGGLLATTLGAEGAALEQGGSEIARARPPAVDAVDTTGAGDAFCGALLVGLLEARPNDEALLRACAAGALATTRSGAQASLPLAIEIDRLCS